MENILILTIGQRDLQLVVNDSYYEIEKEEMKFVQDRLGELLTNNQLEWLPISLIKKDGKKKGKIKDLDINNSAIKQITFPIIENLFVFLKYMDIKIDKIYLFYTNRQHFEGKVNPKFIDGEPYLTNKIFNHFYNEISKHYELGDIIIEFINIGEKISDFRYDNLYPFFDNFFKEINQVGMNNIYVATAAGIPTIRNIIEDLTTLNYPNNSIILEQNNKDDINLSEFHKYKNYYRKYNLLRDSIQRWDFTEALNVYNEISINDTNSILVRVLNIANNILFIDEKKAKDNIKKLLKKKDLLENYKNEFEKIKNTLLKSKDNSSFLIFLKFLQVYKTGNYWAATTILVTLLEVLSQELIESYCNGITKEYEGKSYFDIKELKYKDSFMTKKSLKFNEKNKDYFLNNWPGILAVINHLNKNNITVFKGLKVIIDNIKDFKIKRNDFIHNGFGVQKKILDDFLDLDDNIKEEYFNSKLLEFIYKTLIDKNPQYFNWLEYFEEVLLEEIKNIEPNIK